MEETGTYYKAEISKLKTVEDFTALLNRVVADMYPEANELLPIKKSSINYYALPTKQNRNYKEFTVNKKSGGERSIHTPTKGLKYIQRCITFLLEQLYVPHECASGFIKGKSIVDNATKHVGRQYVYNIDVKDFFPSIELHRIKTVLTFKPFEFPENIAFVIANICTINVDNKKAVLPQGAPTSPILSNIVTKKLDKQLLRLARKFLCQYSRYADDITFSANRNVFRKQEFKDDLQKIISENRFELKHSKCRLQNRDGHRQMVTGIVVNKKPNVRKDYIRNIRATLNNWEKLGYEKATEIFREHYHFDKGHVKKRKPEMINVISGKLDYMAMVRGHDDLLVKKYREQYLSLALSKSVGIPTGFDLEKVLDIWEKEGIEKANDMYNSMKS